MPQLSIQTVLVAIGRPDDFVQTIADVQRQPTASAGYGMFATRARPAGEILCVLDGQQIDCEQYPELMHALEWNALSERSLLVRAVRTSYGYINHSPDPNVAIDADGCTLRTTRAIALGEELTIDYLVPPVPRAYLESPEGQLLARVKSTTIYKVLTVSAWQAAQQAGVYEGNADDKRDGFIHFSNAEQLAGTLQKYFAGAPDLVLLYVREGRISAPNALRWEPSRGGALFPHLYAPLPTAAVHRVEPLTLDARGLHVLPELDC